MAKAIDLIIDKEFTSAFDLDKKKTVWLIRTITGGEYMRCTSGGYVDHETIVETGLTGWKGFDDSDDKAIEFSKHNIQRIPPLIFQDISFAIQGLSIMTEKERKNSTSQSK